MKKNLLVLGLLVTAIVLSVPIFSYAYKNVAFWGGNRIYGGMVQGMMESPMMRMMHGNMMNGGGVELKEEVNSEKAKELVKNYIESSGLKGISLAEMMEFENHFYVELKEEKIGKYTQELIVDKKTGTISLEMGPNMMWNTKYGHMGGMMMGSRSAVNDKPAVSPEDAVKIANDYLAKANAGESAAEPHQFYGYYTLHTLRDGKINGMLSVNSFTGQVWYHTWHGNYVSMESADDASHTEGHSN